MNTPKSVVSMASSRVDERGADAYVSEPGMLVMDAVPEAGEHGWSVTLRSVAMDSADGFDACWQGEVTVPFEILGVPP